MFCDAYGSGQVHAAASEVGTFGATGQSAAITAGRVSFCLGLKGASMSIDTEARSVFGRAGRPKTNVLIV